MMDKILKLLKSPNKEDVLIGLEFLLLETPDFIEKFFEAYKDIEGTEWIEIKRIVDPFPRGRTPFYVDLGEYDWGLIFIGGDFRLRRIHGKGAIKSARIITKTDYLNGLY